MLKHRKHQIIAIVLFAFLFSVFGFYSVALSVDRPTLYWGSTGSDVKSVQNKLSTWGYYNGGIDGIFGTDMSGAVKRFQRSNGLGVDGVVGDSTWNALGFSTTPINTENYKPTRAVTNGDEVNALARLICAEAESEPYIGKVAVGAVILNRVQSPEFPKTVASVIFKSGEFESVSNGRYNSVNITDDDVKAAQEAYNGWDPSYGALFFWNPSKPVSSWIWSRKIIATYGAHVFGR